MNKPINSFYHGSNGGISASASESWRIDEYDYFNPMIDGLDSLKKSFKKCMWVVLPDPSIPSKVINLNLIDTFVPPLNGLRN